ncbi:helix-turn-helix domain-containing protein [Methanomassiliicoccaceae archaeon COG_1]|nr:helix-turn-helix domain-containing protein [Methanomassiliicoccaceae archaeon COG_1]
MLREEGGFQKAFRNILDEELHMSLNEFCRMSGISQSTVYKILEERREPNLRTVRDIVKALNQIYRRDAEKFLAVIASPTFMEGLPKQLDTVSNGVVSIREYTVSTVEDAILAAVRAERDGALGIICAPIVANTVEKITTVQVYSVFPFESVMNILNTVKGRF